MRPKNVTKTKKEKMRMRMRILVRMPIFTILTEAGKETRGGQGTSF